MTQSVAVLTRKSANRAKDYFRQKAKNTKLQNVSVLLVGLTICLLPLHWFRPHSIIDGADYNLPFSAGREIAQILKGWNVGWFGSPNFRSVPLLFPYLLFWYLGESIRLSYTAIEQAWMIALFIMAYLSSYYLVTRLPWAGLRNSYVAAIISLVYVFNPFTMTLWAIGQDVNFLAYAAAPLWCAVLITLLTKDASLWLTGIPLGCVSLLFASAFTDMASVLSYIGIPTLLVLATLIGSRRIRAKKAFERLLSGGIWIVTLNLWWFVPMALYSFGGYQYAGSNTSILSWPNLANHVSFFEFIRGMGYWGYYTGYHNVPYFDYANLLVSPVPVLASLFVVVFAIVPVFKDRYRPWGALVAGLYLIGIFFAKATNNPLGFVNRILYLQLPGFFIFRSAYEKFEGLVFLAVLVGAGLMLLSGERTGPFQVVSALALVAASMVASFPMVNGAIAQPKPNGTTWAIKIPGYYDQFASWTKEQSGTGNMLVLPLLGYVKTKWGFIGSNLLAGFSSIPLITGSPNGTSNSGPTFASAILSSTNFTNSSLLRRDNISQILVQGDIDTSYYSGTPTITSIEEKLNHAGFPLVAQFGPIDIFDVPGASVGSTAFSAVGTVHTSGSLNLWLANNTFSPPILLTSPGISARKSTDRIPLCSGSHITVTENMASHTVTVPYSLFVCSGDAGSPPTTGSDTYTTRFETTNDLKFTGVTYAGGAARNKIAATTTGGTSETPAVISVVSHGGHAAIIAQMNHLSPTTGYILSLRYRHIVGTAPSMVIWERGTNRILDQTVLSNAPGWHSLTTAFIPDPGTIGVLVFLYADAPAGSFTENDYGSAQTTSFALPHSYSNRKSPSQLVHELPILSAANGTGWYSGIVNSSDKRFWIVVPTAYSSYWKLSVTNGHGTAKVLSHVMLNQFENGWEISSGGGVVQFKAVFGWPWLVPVCLFLSFIGFTTALLLIGRTRWSQWKHQSCRDTTI